jgi:NADPH:quinone reductase-like Zn-dependent oxidoreductase
MTTTIIRTSRSTTSALQAMAIPGAMKAAALEKFGPPQVLILHTVPVSPPGPGEVMIEVRAAGVGVWDASVRDGSWRPYSRPRFPLVLGTDGAGIVVARGPRVRRFDIGDRVWASDYANPTGGFYAEYAAVNIERVGSMPRRHRSSQVKTLVLRGDRLLFRIVQQDEAAMRLRFTAAR